MNSLWDIRIFLGLVPKESPCIRLYGVYRFNSAVLGSTKERVLYCDETQVNTFPVCPVLYVYNSRRVKANERWWSTSFFIITLYWWGSTTWHRCCVLVIGLSWAGRSGAVGTLLLWCVHNASQWSKNTWRYPPAPALITDTRVHGLVTCGLLTYSRIRRPVRNFLC